MSLSVGIVGMPNAGKSTLFNLVTGLSVPAENYPFNTIEPNIGVVEHKDRRIDTVANLVNPEKISYPLLELHDIAGLVKGASSGEGLGNKFLANIREVDAILMVLRGFTDSNVMHTLNTLDPRRDREILEYELILKDLETVSKRKKTYTKELRFDSKAQSILEFLSSLESALSEGVLAYNYIRNLSQLEESIIDFVSEMHLLTNKPIIYLLNTTDYELSGNKLRKLLNIPESATVVAMDVKLEYELILEAKNGGTQLIELLSEFGMTELAIDRIVASSFTALNYCLYITAGPKEVKGWPIEINSRADLAAGIIHTDFIKKFIAAEVISYNDFIVSGGWENAKSLGKMKLIGRDQIIHDGDIVYFRIGA